MFLQQPFAEALAAADSVLLAGAGGGYDVLGAVPLFADLVAAGKTVHLAGVSFTALDVLPGVAPHPDHPHLFPVRASNATEEVYCPEAWLSVWLGRRYDYSEPVWCLKKCGVRPSLAAYSHLVRTFDVDALVLVDGGIDLLLRGDETSIGTPAEDLCSLAAADQLALTTKLVACVGFGTELREGVRHAQVLERVAELSRSDAYLGAAALLPGTPGGAAYQDALDFVAAHQPGQRGSHVHSVVRAAMRGDFGPNGPDVWVSPLSSLFWFFHLPTVARSHLFLPLLASTESIFDATAVIRACRGTFPQRASSDIPL